MCCNYTIVSSRRLFGQTGENNNGVIRVFDAYLCAIFTVLLQICSQHLPSKVLSSLSGDHSTLHKRRHPIRSVQSLCTRRTLPPRLLSARCIDSVIQTMSPRSWFLYAWRCSFQSRRRSKKRRNPPKLAVIVFTTIRLWISRIDRNDGN